MYLNIIAINNNNILLYLIDKRLKIINDINLFVIIKEMLWLTILTLSLAMLITVFSYYYQKSFSSLNKTSKVLITSLAFTIILVFSIFACFYEDLNSIKYSLFKNNSIIVLLFISIINIIFYIIIPFLYFHFTHMEKLSEEGKI